MGDSGGVLLWWWRGSESWPFRCAGIFSFLRPSPGKLRGEFLDSVLLSRAWTEPWQRLRKADSFLAANHSQGSSMVKGIEDEFYDSGGVSPAVAGAFLPDDALQVFRMHGTVFVNQLKNLPLL